MATNLTPQQLAELQRLFSTPVETGTDANAYMPENVFMDGRTYDKRDAGLLAYDYDPNNLNDPRRDQQSLFNGQSFDEYGPGGAYQGSGQFTGIEDSNKLREFMIAAAMMAGPTAMNMLGGGAAAAGGGEMVNGAFLGEAPWTATGGGALDFGAGTSAMGAGGGGGTAYGTMAPLEQMALPASISEAASLGTMAVPGAGLLGKALGVGATVAGGLLGSQGQQSEQSTAKDIPEWLKPYVNKQLGYAGGLLDKQMAPGYMQGYDDMRSVGQGLLNQPIAGNGFAQFQAMPRFGR